MNPENLGYWLPLLVGAPQAVLWFGVVLVLAIVAARRKCSPAIRFITATVAITCGAAAAYYIAVLVWRPVWYSDRIASLAFLVIAICFTVSLHCVIWTKDPPQSRVERQFFMAGGLYFSVLTVGYLAVALLCPGWYQVALAAPYIILLLLGCVVHQRVQHQIRLNHPRSR